jgi:photosystem II stability/assembly factor-like uncharacterized protein
MKALFTVLIFILGMNLTAYSQSRWEKINGPVGGSIGGLYVKGDTVIISGGVKGIVFYSLNKGKNWQQSNLKLNNNILDFIITNDGSIISSGYKNGIYKTGDLINWYRVYYDGNYYGYLGKDIENNIYTGTLNNNVAIPDKIVMSTNNGNNWEVSLNNTKNIGNFLFNIDSSLFAGGWKGILKKGHGSTNWEVINLDTVPSNLYKIFSDSVGNIYAFNVGTYMLMSSDGGNSWKYLDTLGFLRYGNQLNSCLFNQRLIGGMNETGLNNTWGIVLSDDNGFTWRQSNNTGLPPKFSSAYRLEKSGTNTYLGTNAAGVFKSTDFGESWFPINNGITAADVNSIYFDNEGILYSANWSNGFQKSTDMGETWTVINNGLTNSYALSIIADDNGNLIGGTEEGTFKSTDKGENWLPTSNVGSNFMFRLYKDNNNRIYAADFYTGFYRTSDLGLSWQRIDKNFANTRIRGFAVDSSNNLYAGTLDGRIYKSTNDGINWQQIRSHSGSSIVRIEVSPNGNIFAATSGEGILRSTDNGNSWIPVNSGIGWLNAGPLGINKKGEIFTATTEEKVYYSNNNGMSWQNYTSNLNMTAIRTIIFDKDDNLYLATNESVWRSNPDSVTTVVKSEDKVYQFALMQNYPNPFNPVTKIKYAVPSSLSSQERAGVRSFVTLKIYDILGKEVTVLVNKEQETGEYEVEWNASNIPSGVYFYTLRAGELVQTRKLVLLR